MERFAISGFWLTLVADMMFYSEFLELEKLHDWDFRKVRCDRHVRSSGRASFALSIKRGLYCPASLDNPLERAARLLDHDGQQVQTGRRTSAHVAGLDCFRSTEHGSLNKKPNVDP